MQVADLLIQAIKTLPENRIVQVLDFVEFIKQKDARAAESANTSLFERRADFESAECPICAKHRDPETGEPLYNAETIAAIKEGDAMLRGEIPAKWYNSLEEMLEDLDKDD